MNRITILRPNVVLQLASTHDTNSDILEEIYNAYIDTNYEAVSKKTREKISKALTKNNNTPFSVLLKLALNHPGLFLENDSVDLYLSSNPSLLMDIYTSNYHLIKRLFEYGKCPSKYIEYWLNHIFNKQEYLDDAKDPDITYEPISSTLMVIFKHHHNVWNNWLSTSKKKIFIRELIFVKENLGELSLANIDFDTLTFIGCNLENVSFYENNIKKLTVTKDCSFKGNYYFWSIYKPFYQEKKELEYMLLPIGNLQALACTKLNLDISTLCDKALAAKKISESDTFDYYKTRVQVH
jgi:hypothetical protein